MRALVKQQPPSRLVGLLWVHAHGWARLADIDVLIRVEAAVALAVQAVKQALQVRPRRHLPGIRVQSWLP